jgi:hypothetical protein
MVNNIVVFDADTKAVQEVITLKSGIVNSNTCLIDFAIDKRGNILARNYGNTIFFDGNRSMAVVDLKAYSAGTI